MSKPLRMAFVWCLFAGVGCSVSSDPSDSLESSAHEAKKCRNTPNSVCSSTCPCEEGQGYCDSDLGCVAGTHCGANNVCVANPVYPACGAGSTDQNHAAPPGDESYCTASCLCAAGEGDCDSDAECVAGTHCGAAGVCEVNPVYPACGAGSTDQNHAAAPGDESYCTVTCLCAAGEGDCDSDAECVAGTVCDGSSCVVPPPPPPPPPPPCDGDPPPLALTPADASSTADEVTAYVNGCNGGFQWCGLQSVQAFTLPACTPATLQDVFTLVQQLDQNYSYYDWTHGYVMTRASLPYTHWFGTSYSAGGPALFQALDAIAGSGPIEAWDVSYPVACHNCTNYQDTIILYYTDSHFVFVLDGNHGYDS